MNYELEIRKGLNEIDQLIALPNMVRDFAIDGLNGLDLHDTPNTGKGKINNLKLLLQNINDGSFKSQYQIVYNQSCVLAVSLLANVLEQYFVNFVSTNWKTISFPNDVRVSLHDLRELDFELRFSTQIGKLWLSKDRSINFQDFGSTIRTFEIVRGTRPSISQEVTNKIVYYQQVRHVLAHTSASVDEEFLKKVSPLGISALPKLGELLKLSEENWLEIKKYFPEYIKALIPRPTQL